MTDRITESPLAISDDGEEGARTLSATPASSKARARGVVSETLLAQLTRSLAVGTPEDREDVIDEMRRAGVSDAEIADRYIPEIARRVGAAWTASARSFVDVSVITSQLQSLLREMSGRTRDNPLVAGAAPCVAVVVEAGEAHTLGAMVLSNQLRRHGVSVRQIMGRDHAEIVERLADEPVDAIMISVGRREGLASLGRLVKKLRHSGLGRVPIVIGGPVLAYEHELTTRTGADFIATDATKALEACGLIEAARSDVLRLIPA